MDRLPRGTLFEMERKMARDDYDDEFDDDEFYDDEEDADSLSGALAQQWGSAP